MRHGWFRRGVRGIAQLVEQWSPKPRAEGSNPSAPANFSYRRMSVYAAMAQVVEHILGKDEVGSSSLPSSSSLKASARIPCSRLLLCRNKIQRLGIYICRSSGFYAFMAAAFAVG